MRHAHLIGSIAACGTLLLTSCGKGSGCSGDYCGTLIIAAPGEPTSLLPAVTDEALDRDIFRQVFLKLADIGPDGNTVGDQGFEPQLAQRWEWTGPLTLTLHLDPRARWQDGPPVTAPDVAFTFWAYTDTTINSPFTPNLRNIASVTAQDSLTVVVKFKNHYPEMFYDAVYHMHILPEHLLKSLPPAQWHAAQFGRAPVGDGPYKFVSWTQGQTLELARDPPFFLGRPYLRRVIWRFASDLNVAVTQVVAGEADAIQVLLSPPNIQRAQQSGHLTLYHYPGSVYTFLNFNMHASGDKKRPHPIFSDPDVRRALVLATDRERMLQSVLAGNGKVPPAPIPQVWKDLWTTDVAVPPFDTAQAKRLLDARGWKDSNGDGIRDRGGNKLSFHVLVPTSSAARRQYAQLIQEELRGVGVEVLIDEVDVAAQQDKQRAGAFDASIESWQVDPTPTSGIPQMWQRGGASNFSDYYNPAFDRAVEQAVHATPPDAAARAWRESFTTLAHDAPAMMLYAPDNVAAVDQRFTNVRLRSDDWWAYLRTWRVPADKLTDRDRLGH